MEVRTKKILLFIVAIILICIFSVKTVIMISAISIEKKHYLNHKDLICLLLNNGIVPFEQEKSTQFISLYHVEPLVYKIKNDYILIYQYADIKDRNLGMRLPIDIPHKAINEIIGDAKDYRKQRVITAKNLAIIYYQDQNSNKQFTQIRDIIDKKINHIKEESTEWVFQDVTITLKQRYYSNAYQIKNEQLLYDNKAYYKVIVQYNDPASNKLESEAEISVKDSGGEYFGWSDYWDGQGAFSYNGEASYSDISNEPIHVHYSIRFHHGIISETMQLDWRPLE